MSKIFRTQKKVTTSDKKHIQNLHTFLKRKVAENCEPLLDPLYFIRTLAQFEEKHREIIKSLTPPIKSDVRKHYWLNIQTWT